MFKSADYGDSWSSCQGLQELSERIDWTFPIPPHVAHVRGLGLCQTDPAVIFGAGAGGWGVRSTDGGETLRAAMTRIREEAGDAGRRGGVGAAAAVV